MSSIHFIAGNFFGRNGQSAARWLKRVKWELQKETESSTISPSELLRTIEFSLTEDAEDWIETHKEAHHLLSLETPLQKDVDRFVTLFEKKFPAKPRDTNRKGFVAELRELQQGPEESITMYYKRVQHMMTQVDVRDRPTSSEDEELGFLEDTTLDTILEAFTRGRGGSREGGDGNSAKMRPARDTIGRGERRKEKVMMADWAPEEIAPWSPEKISRDVSSLRVESQSTTSHSTPQPTCHYKHSASSSEHCALPALLNQGVEAFYIALSQSYPEGRSCFPNNFLSWIRCKENPKAEIPM